MIDAPTCAAALWPDYVVVFRPGFVGLLTTCIVIAFLKIVWDSIDSDPGPPPRRK